MTRDPIYLDYNATTPVDEKVFEAMRPFFVETFGNAASRSHAFGTTATKAVAHARTQVAAILRANPNEIVWTSGSTEGNNLAIKGVAAATAAKGRHIVTQPTEHKAVLDCYKTLAKQGYEVTMLPVDSAGQIDLADLEKAIRKDTVLVSLMWANNEIGTILPIRAIGQLCRARGVTFHTDATQAVGKLNVDVNADGIDLLSVSAHKLYGPKGAGALYIRQHDPKANVVCQMDGGGHEFGYRSGTLNVSGIVGLGAACELAFQTMDDERVRLSHLRDKLQRGIISQLDGVFVNGDERSRLAHCTNLSFAEVDGTALLDGMDDVAVSSGSACTSASIEPSFVLKAIGRPNDLAHASIRFSLGKRTTARDIDYTIEKVVGLVSGLRSLNSLLSPAVA